jgi:hypothetical protein
MEPQRLEVLQLEISASRRSVYFGHFVDGLGSFVRLTLPIRVRGSTNTACHLSISIALNVARKSQVKMPATITAPTKTNAHANAIDSGSVSRRLVVMSSQRPTTSAVPDGYGAAGSLFTCRSVVRTAFMMGRSLASTTSASMALRVFAFCHTPSRNWHKKGRKYVPL